MIVHYLCTALAQRLLIVGSSPWMEPWHKYGTRMALASVDYYQLRWPSNSLSHMRDRWIGTSFRDSIHAAHAIDVKAHAEGCGAWCERTTRHVIYDWDGVNEPVALIRLAVHLRAGLLKIVMPSLLTLLFSDYAS
jgi:hypothetical protein